ncbi:MAG TPA: SEC-C metal-binding domain-containing protein, partial [Stellaceae bacterium]
WINKALEKAQQKVEARNYEIRKQLLKFDDVMNDQRKVIYEQRKEIMASKDVAATISDMRHETVDAMVGRTMPENSLADQWDIDTLHEETLRVFNLELPVAEWAKEEGIAEGEVRERVTQAVDAKMAQKAANYGADIMRMAEKSLLLQLLDQSWKDHLLQLDHLRQGINLRAYAQRDPLNEYKREAFQLFGDMLVGLRETVTRVLAYVELRVQRGDGEEAAPPPVPPPRRSPLIESHEDPAYAEAGGGAAVATATAAAVAAPWGKTPRNAPCPCGSGKKYKHCHGRI